MDETKYKLSFTDEQIKSLEKAFPEIIGTHETTVEQLRIQQGIRKVINYIKTRQLRN